VVGKGEGRRCGGVWHRQGVRQEQNFLRAK
jgi:hypothetical protein